MKSTMEGVVDATSLMRHQKASATSNALLAMNGASTKKMPSALLKGKMHANPGFFGQALPTATLIPTAGYST